MNVRTDLERIKKANDDYHAIGNIVAYKYDTNTIDIVPAFDKSLKNYITGNAGIILSRYTDKWHDRTENVEFLSRYASEIRWDKNKVKVAFDEFKQTSFLTYEELWQLTDPRVKSKRKRTNHY
jgi:hypothetical protein